VLHPGYGTDNRHCELRRTQYLGEGLPLTHYVRIVRAIMLKGATLPNLQYDTIALIALMLLAMRIAVTRFRRTLD
jgi:ABC-2 type transport system permease protein